jgi:hypothetical protein
MLWSFFIPGKQMQCGLRGLGVLAALAGITFSMHFANTTEVPETPDKEPTGFKSDSTDLHLE